MSSALPTLFAVCATSASGQTTFEHDIFIVEPFHPGASSESSFEGVVSGGTAWGSSTVAQTSPGGNTNITNQDIIWNVDGTWSLSRVSAVNERGDRVIDAPNLLWSTVHYAAGGTDRIDVLPGGVALWPQDINESGMVVGASREQGSISQGSPRDGFYWTPATGTVNLNDPTRVPEALQANAVNDSGEIVGVRGNGLFASQKAFYYDTVSGQYVDLHSLLVNPGAPGARTDAQDINNAGVVVGWRFTSSTGFEGFSWTAQNGFTFMPIFAEAINDDGVIVGGDRRYTPTRGVEDLHSLADFGTFTILRSVAIANDGTIVGWGRRQGFVGTTAFMMVPRPELGTRYCTAAANSVASTGARIMALGSESISAADLVLIAHDVPAQPGLFYFGPARVLLPAGDGFRCVGDPAVRLPVTMASDGRLTSILNVGVVGPLLQNMGTVHFQAWYRDPAAGGSGLNFSDAVEVTFVP